MKTKRNKLLGLSFAGIAMATLGFGIGLTTSSTPIYAQETTPTSTVVTMSTTISGASTSPYAITASQTSTITVEYRITKIETSGGLADGIDILQLQLDYDHDAFALTTLTPNNNTTLGRATPSGLNENPALSDPKLSDIIVWDTTNKTDNESHALYVTDTEPVLMLTATFSVLDTAISAETYNFSLVGYNSEIVYADEEMKEVKEVITSGSTAWKINDVEYVQATTFDESAEYYTVLNNVYTLAHPTSENFNNDTYYVKTIATHERAPIELASENTAKVTLKGEIGQGIDFYFTENVTGEYNTTLPDPGYKLVKYVKAGSFDNSKTYYTTYTTDEGKKAFVEASNVTSDNFADGTYYTLETIKANKEIETITGQPVPDIKLKYFQEGSGDNAGKFIVAQTHYDAGTYYVVAEWADDANFAAYKGYTTTGSDVTGLNDWSNHGPGYENASYTITKATLNIAFATKSAEYKSFTNETFAGYKSDIDTTPAYMTFTVGTEETPLASLESGTTVNIDAKNIFNSVVRDNPYNYVKAYTTETAEEILVSITSSNYTLGKVSGGFTITKKIIDLTDPTNPYATFSDVNRTYNGQPHSIDTTNEGADNPSIAEKYTDILQVQGYSGGENGGCATNVGVYTITVTFEIAEEYQGNYAFKLDTSSQPIDTLTATLTISAIGLGKDYVADILAKFVDYVIVDNARADSTSDRYLNVTDTDTRTYTGLPEFLRVDVKTGDYLATSVTVDKFDQGEYYISTGTAQFSRATEFVTGTQYYIKKLISTKVEYSFNDATSVTIDTATATKQTYIDANYLAQNAGTYTVKITFIPATGYAFADPSKATVTKELIITPKALEISVSASAHYMDAKPILEIAEMNHTPFVDNEYFNIYYQKADENAAKAHIIDTYVKYMSTEVAGGYFQGMTPDLLKFKVLWAYGTGTTDAELTANATTAIENDLHGNYDVTLVYSSNTQGSDDHKYPVVKAQIDTLHFSADSIERPYNGTSTNFVVKENDSTTFTSPVDFVEYKKGTETTTLTAAKDVADNGQYYAVLKLKDGTETTSGWAYSDLYELTGGVAAGTTTFEVPFTVAITPIALSIAIAYNEAGTTATFTLTGTYATGESETNLGTVTYAVNNDTNKVSGNVYTAGNDVKKQGTVSATTTNSNYKINSNTLKWIYFVSFSDGTYDSTISGDNTPQNMPETQYIFAGYKATEPTTSPTLKHYEFSKWIWLHDNSDFDFNTELNQTYALAAVWTEKTDKYTLVFKYTIDSKGELKVLELESDIKVFDDDELVYSDGTTGNLPELEANDWFVSDFWFTNDTLTNKLADGTLVSALIAQELADTDKKITLYGNYKFNIGTGDVNADGSVGADDITLYRQWIVGGYEMTVIETGDEWAFINNEPAMFDKYKTSYSDAGVYFLKRVADLNAESNNSTTLGDKSLDIRDVSTIRMAMVGGYGFNIVEQHNVTDEEVVIDRILLVDSVEKLAQAIPTGLKIKLTADFDTANQLDLPVIDINKNVYIDLNGHKLTLKTLNLAIAENLDRTITILNGTIETTAGCTIVAPAGSLILNNVTVYEAGNEITLQAASNSLHFQNNVKFYTTGTTLATVKIPATTHVVLESDAVLTLAKIEVQPVDTVPNAVLTIENNSTAQTTPTVVDNNNQPYSLAQVSINGVGYASLKSAFENAQNGDEIVVLDDITITDDLSKQADRIYVTNNVILNLNGKKITYTGTKYGSGVITIKRGATLTINDENNQGGIYSTTAYAAIAITAPNDSETGDKATLVVNGGNFSGKYYAIVGNGNRHNTEITINDGTFSATATDTGVAIYNPQDGKLTINGGTFTGLDSAIEMRGGELVINDGTFTATATSFAKQANGNGNTVSGAALAISQHTTNKAITATINGGTFTGVYALAVVDTVNTSFNDHMTVIINDGTFRGNSLGAFSLAVYAHNGTVTINDGTFSVAGTEGNGNSTIYALNYGKVIINGGEFSSDATFESRYWVLNIKNNTEASLVVYGGIFHNFDPSTPDTDDLPNYVAEGYQSVEDNGVWTVSKITQ